MYWDIFIFTTLLSGVCADPFFVFSDKPIFFCWKVCPLYCSPRRGDLDADSFIYIEDSPFHFKPDIWIEDSPYHSPYHYGHYVFCKPIGNMTTMPMPTTTTTTTMAPTTEEPTWICEVCKKKCNYPKS
ncbi:hypothetical protein B5X24_HaOG212089 [Helicoverpa armigera]|uniref:Uncharacterized protein n=1 Tax=Helicoverpa armigera TaxID=29058 RepID=A0A2W1B8F5_HELAM|nr:hypothetical protein B5X24_HaOG212089 [Helicoverpa armigera]